MNILFAILLIILGIIAVVLLIALFTKKEYSVEREIVINVPLTKAFDYIRHLKNQSNYNKWVMVDPEMKTESKGTDGTEGFVFGWNGNKKAGEGEQEIKKVLEGKNILTEVRFVRPFPGVAYSTMETEPVSETATKVKWSTSSKMKYPMNIMVSFINKMLGKDLETSLSNLKLILEK